MTSIGHYHYENMNFGLCRILLAIINGNIDKDFKIPGPPPNTAVQDSMWDFITIVAFSAYVNQFVFGPA